MEKKQNLGKIQFKLKSELYTQYQTVCSKLPELSVISEYNNSIVFDTACLSYQNSSEPDIFSQNILTNNYLNFTSQLSQVEPQSLDGARIILALYHIDWSSIFSEINGLPLGTQIHSVLYQLSQELKYVGLDLTGHCYKELEDYRTNESGNLEPPQPKNNWLTIIAKKLYSRKIDTGGYFDIQNYYKSLERYQKKGEIHKQTKLLQAIFSSLGLRKDQPIQKEHTTYYSSNGSLVNRWLINPYVNDTPPLESLISYCIGRIEPDKIETAILKILRKTLTETFKDSSQLTTTSLKFISSEIRSLVEKVSRELAQAGPILTMPGEGKLHEYAFKQMLKLISEKALEEQQKNLKMWIQEKKRLQDFFISQVMVKKNEETDKALTQTIVKALEDKVMCSLKTKAQAEYNILLEKNQDLFTRDTLQNLADAHLIDSRHPDLVLKYIIDPVNLFKQEFETCWSDFLRNCSKDILRLYQTVYYSLDACIDFFRDIREQLKKVYSKKDEVEIFKIYLRDGNEFSEEFSKSVRQAQLEAPFKCLGLFLNKENFQTFKINGFLFEANLPLVWNVHIDQDEIQQEIFKSLSNESYQTFNLDCFLYHFILQLEQFSERIKNIAFERLELALQKNEMKLLAIGCTQTCPVCGRICDACHGSNPGCQLDPHECKKGHQYQAMRGVRYTRTNEAVLETCNDQKDELKWIWKGNHTTWGEMKESESLKEWNYDTLPSEQAVLNGKFYRAWIIAGEKICRHYKIIHHNHFGKKY